MVLNTSRRSVAAQPDFGTAGGIRPTTSSHSASVASVLLAFRFWQLAACSDMRFPPTLPCLNSLRRFVTSVEGTVGDDNIRVTADRASGGVSVWVNGAASGPFVQFSRVVVFGSAGDDDIR